MHDARPPAQPAPKKHHTNCPLLPLVPEHPLHAQAPRAGHRARAQPVLAVRRADGRVGGPFAPLGGAGAQLEHEGQGVRLCVQRREEEAVFGAAGGGERRREDRQPHQLACCEAQEEEGGGVEPGEARAARGGEERLRRDRARVRMVAEWPRGIMVGARWCRIERRGPAAGKC